MPAGEIIHSLKSVNENSGLLITQEIFTRVQTTREKFNDSLNYSRVVRTRVNISKYSRTSMARTPLEL